MKIGSQSSQTKLLVKYLQFLSCKYHTLQNMIEITQKILGLQKDFYFFLFISQNLCLSCQLIKIFFEFKI